MNDLPALLYLAGTLALVIYIAWNLERPTPRRPKIGRDNIRRIMEVR